MHGFIIPLFYCIAYPIKNWILNIFKSYYTIYDFTKNTNPSWT